MRKTENYIRLFGIIFFARLRTILVVACLFSAAATAAAFLLPPVYQLAGSVIVKSKKIYPPPESVLGQTGYATVIPPVREDVILETRIVASEDLIRIALEELRDKGELDDNTRDEEEFAGLVVEIAKRLKVEILPGSHIIDIVYRHKDPVLGAKILNAILDNYLVFRLNILVNQNTGEFFADQAARYNEQLNALQDQKLAILKNASITDIQTEISSHLAIVSIFKESIQSLEEESLKKERQASHIEKTFKEYLEGPKKKRQPFPYNFEDSEIARFTERLNVLLIEHADSLRIFKTGTQKIKSINAQIDQLWDKLSIAIQNKIEYHRIELEALEETILIKRQRLEELLLRNKQLTEAQSALDRVETELALAKENYQVFSKKLEQSRIEGASQVTQMSNVQVLNRASIPIEPFFPRKKIVIPIGLLAGLLLGFSAAYIREFFDHTFKTPQDIADRLDLPVIGSIPRGNR